MWLQSLLVIYFLNSASADVVSPRLYYDSDTLSTAIWNNKGTDTGSDLNIDLTKVTATADVESVDNRKALCFNLEGNQCVKVPFSINPSDNPSLTIEIYALQRGDPDHVSWIMSSDTGFWKRSIIMSDARLDPDPATHGLGATVGHEYDALDTLQHNKWYHIVAVWNGATMQATTYKNYNQETVTEAINVNDGTLDYFCLNTNPAGSSNHDWNGCLSQIRIWDSALTDNDVQTLFHQYTGDGYQVIKESLSVTAAKQACRDEFGTDLASIHDAADQKAVTDLCTNLAGNPSYCLLGGYGGHINAPNCDFAWDDGTLYDFVPEFDGVQGCVPDEPRLCIKEDIYGLHDCSEDESGWPICNPPSVISYAGFKNIISKIYVDANDINIRAGGMCLQWNTDLKVTHNQCIEDQLNQLWSYDAISGEITNVEGKCLTGIYPASTSMTISDCDSSAPQQWSFSDVDQIKNAENHCINVHGWDFSPSTEGGKVQIWSCYDGGSNEVFEFRRYDGAPVDCQMGEWVDIGDCSVECGGGLIMQAREIMADAQHGGYCGFVTEQEATCNTESCAVHCQVGEWELDGECSKICGSGQQKYKREIIISDENGGNECPELTKTEDCNINECCSNMNLKTFNWDILTSNGGTEIPYHKVTEFKVLEGDLSLNIEVEVGYVGKASADDEKEANFGTTYILDFEDFHAHKDRINEPGTCQNREASSFTNCIADNFNDCWLYSDEPQNGNIGSNDFLAYPPPPSDIWTISMKENGCDTVIYKGHFTWQELRDCTSFLGPDSYTKVVADDNWLNLTGTFYINVVSPFWYGVEDTGYYRVYQLLSQPFVIAVSSTVYVLGSAGINLITACPVAVYKENDERDFKLILMTETAEYMQLIRDKTSIITFKKADNNNDINAESINFIASIEAESDCLSNKEYLCTQLWQINATDIDCKPGDIGTDFSGKYGLTFKPLCKEGPYKSHCDEWLTDHTDIMLNEPISLSADLVWKDTICKAEVFTVELSANMLFYEDGNYNEGENVDTNSYLYQVGESDVFVEIITNFPSATETIFNTKLINVWLCTFAPGIDPRKATDGTELEITSMGCFNSQRDTEYDTAFRKIYTTSTTETIPKPHLFNLIPESITNIIRFSFVVPYEVARDTLYVHAQIEVELQEIVNQQPRRRRMLLDVNTANKMQHFGDEIGINHGQKLEHRPQQKPKQQEPQKQAPQKEPKISSKFVLSLSSPWIIIIGSLLALILIFNIIFICYSNCCNKNGERERISFRRRKRKNGYKFVNNINSDEFDESEANAINVISE